MGSRTEFRGFETAAIHGHGYSSPYGDVVPAIHVSAAYRFVSEDDCVRSDRGYPIKYSREENPTVRAFERVLGVLECGDALAFSSGMSAIATVVFSRVWSGARRIVVLEEMYGTTIQLLERVSRVCGIELVKVYPSTESVIEAVREGDFVMVEVMTNPTLKVIDVAEVAKACRDAGAVLAVDNTFTTPLLVKPLRLGAWASIHSATKYIAGHNDVIGGAAIVDPRDVDELWHWRRMLGTSMHPLEAYLCLRGVKTLGVRFERQCLNAKAVAEFLAEHPRVESVSYPGLESNPWHGVALKLFERKLFGAVVSFRVRGGLEDAKRFLRRLRLIKPAPSLGGCESLATLPALSAAKWIDPEARRRLGISENLVRLSIGLESLEDIIEDLDRALSG